MRIALLQAAGEPGDVAANAAAVRRAAREAAAGGAGLLICPECFTTGYAIGADRIADLAEPAGGPTGMQLRKIAEESRIAVLCGYPERDGDTVYNSALLIDSYGAVLTNYRKTHLFADLDRTAFAPGDRIAPVTRVGDLKVGVLLCYDVEFPEPARQLAIDGAQLIAVPTALMTGAAHVAQTLVPARAIENQVWVAYANRIGSEGELHYIGRSVVAGPGGEKISANGEATLLFADVDPDAVDRARTEQSYLDDRRPGLYGD